jgi:hypothetical protein
MISAKRVPSVNFELTPKKSFWTPVETKLSGFRLQTDQRYCGFGTFGEVLQGIMFKKRDER